MSPRLMRVLSAATMIVMGTAACSQQASPPAAATTAPVSSTPVSSPSPAAAATAAATPAAALKDGRWPGFLKKIDGDTAVTMDLVEFLTGDAAIKAWQKKYPDSGEDVPPNDYFIVNDNTKVRTLPLADALVVRVVGDNPPEAEKKVPLADLGKLLNETLFWFTVKSGEVTEIEEQYVP